MFIVQKYKDPNAAAEMNSLKYAQKMIDLRLSYMKNNRRDTDRDCNSMSNLPIIPLDEILGKELTLSYYLDYLSVLNLQRYVIFYLSARGTHSQQIINKIVYLKFEFEIMYVNHFCVDWKATVSRYTVELQTSKLKGTRENVNKLLRSKANDIYTEVQFACAHPFINSLELIDND